jgi:hypothetical protein
MPLSADEKLAGKACRSVHLGYGTPKALAYHAELVVQDSAPGTYFCAIGWDKGYFGLQELGDGKKLAIFSVWDSGQDDPKKVDESRRVKTIHKDPKVRVGRFGGEGTGGQSFFDFDWKPNTPYNFVVTAGAEGERTEYAGYLFDPAEKAWRHLVTFSTITGGKTTMGGFYSFVEDFKRDKVSLTKRRAAHFGDCWALDEKKAWKPAESARFTGDGNPANNIDAEPAGNGWTLATGGDTTNVHSKLREAMKRPGAVEGNGPKSLPKGVPAG